MSLTLELKLEPEVVLEAASLTPENLAYKSYREIAAVKLLYGKETVSLGDFYYQRKHNRWESCGGR